MALFDRPESDQSLKNLGTLLSRLDHTLDDDDDAAQPRSIYERQKIRANFEHARALLLRLEHESAAVKTASRRQALQTDLRAKRDLVKRLQARVQLLDGAAGPAQDGSDEDDEDEDDEGAQARGHGDAGSGAGLTTARAEEEKVEEGTRLESTLRSRIGGSSTVSGATAMDTASATSTALPAVNGDNRGLAHREETLSSDRQEQEQIMESLLSLTRELKSSATTFHGSLEGEKNLLNSAVTGLDSNVSGLDSAGKKMGMLQKMSEGKGWFGRLMLYAYIAGLWVLALVIVFVLPKLRF